MYDDSVVTEAVNMYPKLLPGIKCGIFHGAIKKDLVVNDLFVYN